MVVYIERTILGNIGLITSNYENTLKKKKKKTDLFIL